MSASALSLPATDLKPALSVGGTIPMALAQRMFDHVPEVAFFIKDAGGRYVAANQSLVERCGLEDKREVLGRDVWQIYPRAMAEIYDRQDRQILRTGRAIVDHLEMHWYAHRKPGWCLTTKLPVFDENGAVVGVAGVSCDVCGPSQRYAIPAGLARALAYLEAHYPEPLSPSGLAVMAGLHPARFARLIKRIFSLTPKQLIRQVRLNEAAARLADSKESVADVAIACGFYDHSALAALSFTWMAWMRTTQGGTILARAGAGKQWQAGGKAMFVKDGRLQFDVGWVGATGARAPVADGQWHHVAVTVSSRSDGDNVLCYVDGKVSGSGRLNFGQHKEDRLPIRIGFCNDDFPQGQCCFVGDLDEIGWYRYALSASEVDRFHRAAKPTGQRN